MSGLAGFPLGGAGASPFSQTALRFATTGAGVTSGNRFDLLPGFDKYFQVTVFNMPTALGGNAAANLSALGVGNPLQAVVAAAVQVSQ